jgi:hypothetical protein
MNVVQDEIEVIIPLRVANVSSFVLFCASLIIFGIPFSFIWSWQYLLFAWREFLSGYLLLFVSLLCGVILHEGLHALTWALFSRNGWRSVSFGINWKHLAPYVHCAEYLPRNNYLAGVITPGVALGILPLLIALISGSGWLFCFGAFFTAGAAGDFLCALRLFSFRRSDQILDHPENLGFKVLRSDAEK